MTAESPSDVAAAIVGFCRFARTRGLSVGVQATLAALAAAASLGIARQEDLKCGLRSALCSSKEEWDLFDGALRGLLERLKSSPREAIEQAPGSCRVLREQGKRRSAHVRRRCERRFGTRGEPGGDRRKRAGAASES